MILVMIYDIGDDSYMILAYVTQFVKRYLFANPVTYDI